MTQGSVATQTSLVKSSRIAEWTKSLETTARRYMPVEEREYLTDGLRRITEAYAADVDEESDDEQGDE